MPDALTLLCEAIVAIVFLASSLHKLSAPKEFAKDVERFELLPAGAAKPFAIALPLLELAVSFALLFRVAPRIGVGVAGVLLVLFSGALAVKLLQGKRVPCGCFGSDPNELIGWNMLGRNVLLVSCCVFAAVNEGGGAQHALAERLTLLGAGALVCLAWAQASTALRLWRFLRDEKRTGELVFGDGE